jgi:putative transposase
MKRGRFSEEQIIAVLKEADGGAKVTEVCRKHGISDATFYNWRSRYGGLEISELRRLRRLEKENRRLKGDRSGPGARHPGAEGRAGKKRVRPAVKRELVAGLMAMHGLSQRRACGLIEITRRSFRRAPKPDRNRELRAAQITGRGAAAPGLPDALPGTAPRRLAGKSQKSRAGGSRRGAVA